MTVRQLAAKASVSVASIKMAECGSLDVDLLSLFKLAEALDVNVCELLSELPDVTKISDFAPTGGRIHFVRRRRRRIALLP